MTERHLTVTVGEKVQERPVPHVRLRQGKYGMKLDIVRDGSFLQRVAQALSTSIPCEMDPLNPPEKPIASFNRWGSDGRRRKRGFLLLRWKAVKSLQ